MRDTDNFRCKKPPEPARMHLIIDPLLVFLPFKLYLPEYKYCQLGFLQQIITEEKMAFAADCISNTNVKKFWYEFAVRNAYPNVKQDAQIIQYLPTKKMDRGKYCDRQYFWNVCSTVRPEFVREYTQQVLKCRYREKPVKERTQIIISKEWVQKPTQHDFVSRKSSILIRPKPAVKTQVRRKINVTSNSRGNVSVQPATDSQPRVPDQLDISILQPQANENQINIPRSTPFQQFDPQNAKDRSVKLGSSLPRNSKNQDPADKQEDGVQIQVPPLKFANVESLNPICMKQKVILRYQMIQFQIIYDFYTFEV